MSGIIKVKASVVSLITLASTLIIPDITKTSSNYRLKLHQDKKNLLPGNLKTIQCIFLPHSMFLLNWNENISITDIMSLIMSTTKKRGSLIGFATRYIYSVVDSENLAVSTC